MRKPIRKLGLHRETLRNLQFGQLKAGVGAADSDTSCNCRYITGCECYTQDMACTLPPTAVYATC
jgi:hypothetical protein